MNKIFLFVLALTALDLCSTRSNNNQKSKRYKGSSCIKTTGKNVPHFKMVKLYANVTLTCPFTGKNIEFLKSCKPITQSATNNKIRISGNTLTLTKFVVMDGGKYSCQEKSPNGQIKQFSWVLHIKLKHNNRSLMYKERPVKGAVVMDCRNFKGNRLFYSHHKGGARGHLTEVSNRLKKQNNMQELYDLNIDDTGYYYCGTSATQVHPLLRLVVRELPKVKGVSIAKVGDSVHFECDYRGPQRIAWYKDNKPIAGSNVQPQNKATKPKNVLKLDFKVQSYSSGQYACVVTFDNHVTVNQTITFDVFEFQTKNDGFIGNPTRPNATVYVFCQTNQDSKQVKYSLLRNPVLTNVSSPYRKVTGSRITQYFPGLFAITSLRAADEGYYKCRASFKGLTIEKKLTRPIWLST